MRALRWLNAPMGTTELEMKMDNATPETTPLVLDGDKATMKVKVTEYRGFLAIEAMEPEVPHPDWAPIGPGRFGCVVNNTKTSLGISKGALAIIAKLPKSRDSIGVIMWFETSRPDTSPTSGSAAFGWMGGPLCIIDPKDADTGRATRVHEGHWIDIPNDTSTTLREAIDADLGPT